MLSNTSSVTAERTPLIPFRSAILAYIINGTTLQSSTIGYLCKSLILQRQALRGYALRYQNYVSSRSTLQYFSGPPRIGGITPIILRKFSQSWLGISSPFRRRTLTATQIDLSFFTKVKSPVTNGELSVDFSDIQNLQILTDKLHQISQILTLNMNIGSQVQKFVKRLKSAWLPLDSSSTWVFDECDAKIEESIFVHRIHKGRIDSMLERSRGVSGLVRLSSSILPKQITETMKL